MKKTHDKALLPQEALTLIIQMTHFILTDNIITENLCRHNPFFQDSRIGSSWLNHNLQGGEV